MADSYLENALVKLSRQLVAFDEASLMDLWEKYAEAVRQFEPTRRWEESVLIFGLIQAVRMKNQLFNYNLSASRQPGAAAPGFGMLDLTAPQSAQDQHPSKGSAGAQARPGDRTGATAGDRPEERPGTRPAARSSVRLSKPKAGKLIPLHRSED